LRSEVQKVESCDAKVELNHRSQVCEALTDTGIRAAKNEPLIFAYQR